MDNKIEHQHASCCGHEPKQNTELEQKLDIATLALGGLMLFIGLIWESYLTETEQWMLLGVPYLLCGYPVLSEAWTSLRKGNFFDEFTLMGGATLAALCLGEPAEALGVMIFYRVGEMFQELASGKTRSSIKSLLASKPLTANVLQDDKIISMAPESVSKGMKVLVKGGEKIPVDGVVLSGEARVDTSSMTGEPVPVRAFAGREVFGGTISLDGSLTIEASGSFDNSAISRIIEMVEHAAERKSPTERFMTKFAARYTPLMFGIAFLTAVVSPLAFGGSWSEWVYRSLVVLMISCPCALVISIPLGYFGGIGAASKRGILVKGGHVLDAMNSVTVVAFDKTGTLTQGVFEVTGIHPTEGVDEATLKHAASIAESLSNHPLARSIQKAFGSVSHVGVTAREIAGKGLVAAYDGKEYIAGNMALMKDLGIEAVIDNSWGTVVYIAEGNRFLGSISVSDILKADAVKAISKLKERGIKCSMLTGDREEGAKWVAEKLNLDSYRSALLPDMKVSALADLTGDADKAAFVGDGFNDAPILASAHVGIAMGGLGSEAAIEVADAVLLNDSPSRVVDLMDIARQTRTIVKQNIVLALAVKLLFMSLGILGLASLWEAIFADVGVALLAILNSSRTGRI